MNYTPNDHENGYTPGGQPDGSYSYSYYKKPQDIPNGQHSETKQPDGVYAYTPPRQYTAPSQAAPEAAPQAEKQSRKGQFTWRKALALCLACALIGGGAGLGAGLLVSGNDKAASGPNTTVVLGSNESPDSASGVASTDNGANASGIYNNNVASCVGIETDSSTNVFGQVVKSAITGSGFIISEDGYIATNYHVIQKALEEDLPVKVMLHDGSEYDATIVGGEQDNDIAVLKIQATGLQPVTLGNSDELSVGEQVYAIGNPLGELTYTMTGGMVSALDRVINTDVSTSINVFQIDAAINSGNSGGPVFNAKGQVVGVATAKYQSTGVEGLGFAVPINDAIHIITELIENGYVTGKPYFGMVVTTVSSTYAQYYNLVEGVCVSSLTEGGAADQAGLQPGDIITALNGEETLDIAALDEVKSQYKAGDTVELTVYRNGQTLTLSLTFDEERPDNAISLPEDGILPSFIPGNAG